MGREPGHNCASIMIAAILALGTGCAYPRPCRCICACQTAKPVAAQAPAPTVSPAYLRQVSGTVQRMEELRAFDEELTLLDARQVTQGLAHPEEAAREGKALTDIAELESKLSSMVKP